jgi:hypothetical protein
VLFSRKGAARGGLWGQGGRYPRKRRGFVQCKKNHAWLERALSARQVDPWQLLPTIETISAVIAHSRIVVAQPYRAVPSLPAGFDYADIAALDWIAAEGRRLGRGLLPM